MRVLLDIPYVGSKVLPQGWHGPTAGLLDKYRQCRRHDIAPPSAPHLSVPAQPLSGNISPEIEEAIAALQAFVSMNHAIVALGMAYSQLAIAAETGPLAVFSAMTKIGGLKRADCQPGSVFINPRVTPASTMGKTVNVEPCFSCPGLVAEVERWNVVVLESSNQPPIRLEGAAAIVAQHEYDHTRGVLCVEAAFNTERPVFYVPPELQEEFFANFHGKDRRQDYPHRFIREQWEAVRTGAYDLESYL